MGLTEYDDPVKIKRDLMVLVPQKEWTMFGHRMIFHGRQVCHAHKPLCEQCRAGRALPAQGINPRVAATRSGAQTALRRVSRLHGDEVTFSPPAVLAGGAFPSP